jgi:tRNA pseudouridine55 synthase
MNGVLVIDKPAGPSSFDVVRRVKTLLHLKRAGHTGTLDPIATGVLPICLEEATKIAGFIAESGKEYEAVIRLGQETDTQDSCGKITAEAEVPPLSSAVLEAALSKFRGEIQQVPPMYSALKHEGKRLYQLAREGKEVQREPRRVVVHRLALRDFSSTEIRISVLCSKGFFMRALAQDIGRELGCGAHLKSLRRTASGPFTERIALRLERLIELSKSDAGRAEIAKALVPMSDALCELPAISVGQFEAARVAHGLPIVIQAPPGRIRILGPAGDLLAVAELEPEHRVRYLRVMAPLKTQC